jgi:hypothetical protein
MKDGNFTGDIYISSTVDSQVLVYPVSDVMELQEFAAGLKQYRLKSKLLSTPHISFPFSDSAEITERTPEIDKALANLDKLKKLKSWRYEP